MSPNFAKNVVAGALCVVACSAHADFLPNVHNLDFTEYTGAKPKNSFTSVAPTGWVGGGGLIYVDAPGTATSSSGGIDVYGPFPSAAPTGGNFVEADGNPDYEGSFSQTITGLTPGVTYTLSFYQAGGQQSGFASGLPTTEQWIVSLGNAGLSLRNDGHSDPLYGPTATYYNTDPNASIAASQLMTTPSGGVTPWQYVSVNLTAYTSTELLSFLAWGDKGSTINLPPIVFLSGVNSVDVLPSIPEPSTWVLLVAGFGVMGVVAKRSRRREESAAS